MALIKCSECGKEVSENAKSCPNCGNPIDNSHALKYCQHCGEQIDKDCVVCPKCGKQVVELNNSGNDRNIIINNNNSASASASASASIVTPVYRGRAKNKWVALFLCIFTFCGHKFYEGKIGMGILYLLTLGLFFVGWITDIISLLGKPNPYYV